MKKALLLGVCLPLLAQQATAQTGTPAGYAVPFKPGTRNILAQQKQSVAAKAATTTERLLAVSFYSDESTTLYDSTRYVYSGTRTSFLDNHNPFTYSDEYDPLEAYLPKPLTVSNANVLQYDSAYSYALGSPAMVLYERCTKEFDSENRATAFNYKNANSGYEERYLMSYAPGRTTPDTVRYYISYTSSFELAEELYITYDGSNRRVADTLVQPFFTDVTVRRYSYTPAGLLARTVAYIHHADGTVDSVSRSNYTYDGSGRLIAALELFSDGAGGLENDQLDSFAYTGSSMLPTKYTRYEYESGAWQADYREVSTLNGFDAYSEQTISIGAFGTLYPSLKSVYTYNANQHIASRKDYMWTGVSFESQPEETFYYYYTAAPVGVSGTIIDSAPLQLYPNPATAGIFITGADKMNISVYNLSGQLMLQQSGTAQNGSLQINISNLPAGTYVADVQTEKGNSKVKFVKQ